ncbi:terminase [Streptococcus agalactiae BSU108]|uniref:phage terminase small subunit P27 family n=1 Tax=Streptococcus agalactiae TaxID=1311 RepID=UPI0002BA83D3|nr:phage terminase small subunit P27 family [Streptococcus agalactiae]EPU00507.1 terminase [Streptococcus agalactiae BSU108]
MGRKLKVVETTKKHLTKEEKIARETAQNKASDGLDKLQITPPRHLNEVARAEYRRIINDLQTLPIRNLDRGLLELYCSWYAIYKETTKKLDEIGYFTNDPDKGLIPSPLILTLEKATANIRSSASQLGLTVDSRMKMFIPKEEEKPKSIFDKFGG